MSLLHKHAAVPVLLRARQAAAAVLQPPVVQSVACYDVARLLQVACGVDKCLLMVKFGSKFESLWEVRVENYNQGRPYRVQWV